jgi:nicotinamide-nucleotide amidase
VKYQIIATGTELTLGLVADRNATTIAARLAGEGFFCQRQLFVPDSVEEISSAIKQALKEADFIILTGGLGPTVDDVTREAIAKSLGLRLVFENWLAELIKQKLVGRAPQLPEAVYRQAYLPAGAKAIKPVLGTAPGIILDYQEKLLFALPGVPAEAMTMLESDVIPVLKQRYASGKFVLKRLIKTTEFIEALVEEKIVDLISKGGPVSIGLLAKPGEVQIELVAQGDTFEEANKYLEESEIAIRKKLGQAVYGVNTETLEEKVGVLLKEKKLTLAVAESCTGGLIAKRLTDIPGSSAFLIASIVAYSNEAKVNYLKVDRQSIRERGAVSEEVALEMASGARESSGADIALSVTGIAGPTGGTEEKEIGLTYIALISDDKSHCQKFLFQGSRSAIRQKASQSALIMLRNYLLQVN